MPRCRHPHLAHLAGAYRQAPTHPGRLDALVEEVAAVAIAAWRKTPAGTTDPSLRVAKQLIQQHVSLTYRELVRARVRERLDAMRMSAVPSFADQVTNLADDDLLDVMARAIREITRRRGKPSGDTYEGRP
jgi:hypothetical protein